MSNVPQLTHQEAARMDHMCRCMRAASRRDKEITAAELKRQVMIETLVKTKQERIDKAFEEYEAMVCLHKAQAKTMIQVTNETMDNEVEEIKKDYTKRTAEYEHQYDVDLVRAKQEDAKDAK